MNDYISEYERWKEEAVELRKEMADLTDIEDAFYRDLEFGTGGLRGILGAGTNRMNVYTVAKASQGLADYVRKNFPGNARIAVAYDSRINSDVFSRVAAGVFAANGIDVYIFPELMPTPALSFAVRYHHCAAGIVITASHNPSEYNGYKVYGPDGCQITVTAAEEILAYIEKLDIFRDVRRGPFEEGEHIRFIGEDCILAYTENVRAQSMLFDENVPRDVSIVYSPLNGTGLKPVLRVLRESGFTNITVVKEQAQPDGRFPTCPYPNPEMKEALALGLKYAQDSGADLLLATDPDADRVGIAVRDGGSMKLLTGNEVGMLLLDFICRRRLSAGRMPEKPVMIKTIVTTDMAERIASHYGVTTVNVLTGFKYIGEQIGLMEKNGEEDRYIFGFEESYGYLSGPYVRDKDAVSASLLICEMFAFYRSEGISLVEKLGELYGIYGCCINTLHSREFAGSAGFARMQEIMAAFRKTTAGIGGRKIRRVLDYAPGLDGLPASDVLKFLLEDGCSLVVRPSGTEPKLKFYISVCAPDRAEAAETEKRILEDIETIINNAGQGIPRYAN